MAGCNSFTPRHATHPDIMPSSSALVLCPHSLPSFPALILCPSFSALILCPHALPSCPALILCPLALFEQWRTLTAFLRRQRASTCSSCPCTRTSQRWRRSCATPSSPTLALSTRRRAVSGRPCAFTDNTYATFFFCTGLLRPVRLPVRCQIPDYSALLGSGCLRRGHTAVSEPPPSLLPSPGNRLSTGSLLGPTPAPVSYGGGAEGCGCCGWCAGCADPLATSADRAA